MTSFSTTFQGFEYKPYAQSSTAIATSGNNYAYAAVNNGSVTPPPTNNTVGNTFNDLSKALGGSSDNQNLNQAMIQVLNAFSYLAKAMGIGMQNQQNAQNLQNGANPADPFNFVAPNASQTTAMAKTANPQAAKPMNSALDKVDKKEVEKFQKYIKEKGLPNDLLATNEKGFPMYLVAKGKKDGKYHIYINEGGKKGKDGKKYGTPHTKLENGNNYLYPKEPQKNKESIQQAKTQAAKMPVENNNSMAMAMAVNNPLADPSVSFAQTDNALAFSYAPGKLDPTGSSAFAFAFNKDNSATQKPVDTKNIAVENKGDYSTGSPLILDTNKDGKVSASHGIGVDVDGNGIADGAATGGDKMLAMGDLDGDGKITGKEVFGDQTIDPFTGQKLNAANGFEALNKVAKSAQANTGINCINEKGEVNLQALQQAIETTGKGSLGMISGNNTSHLEGLGDAASINTTNYIDQKQEGNIQHNQLGSYTSTDGKSHAVHDVWFKLLGTPNTVAA